ncbi:MAG: HesA/MoeB/ThiF family protein [Oscillospiraceae bacterium]|nr:HesA/MoeB/ThiF family protein [Oscillospiraceae bacterium]
MDERFSRQIAFRGIGEDGHHKLNTARIAIVGVGALGTVAADRLCRAGIGYLRLIDPDVVELSNLQRQMLYTEADIGKSKAATAQKHLQAINSEITIDALQTRIESADDSVMQGVDIIIDCTDNARVRYLINESCHKSGIPWIHGAAAGSTGVVCAMVKGRACFRCLYADAEGKGDTAATLGMLSTLTSVVGSLEANEAMKVLVGAPTAGLMMFDIWSGTFEYIETSPDPDCPVCGV